MTEIKNYVNENWIQSNSVKIGKIVIGNYFIFFYYCMVRENSYQTVAHLIAQYNADLS